MSERPSHRMPKLEYEHSKEEEAQFQKNYALAKKEANGCPILGRILMEHLEDTDGKLQPIEVEGITLYPVDIGGHAYEAEGVKDGILYKYEKSHDEPGKLKQVMKYLP